MEEFVSARGKGMSGFGALFRGKGKSQDPNAEDRAAALAARPQNEASKSAERASTDSPKSGDANGRIVLTVTEVNNAHGLSLVTLQTPDEAPLEGYEPGCHADFYLQSPTGEELIRQYSLFPMSHADAEGQGEEQGTYGISVKLENDSRGGSIAVHNLSEGDTVTISTPRNNFGLAPEAKRSILVGAGVGISPIYSLARELKRRGEDYTVLYFASSKERAAMSHLIDEYLHGQTKSIFATGERDKQAGYINEALAASDVDAADTHLYVCGPQGFMDGVIEAASHALPKQNIHWEAFRSSEETLAGDHRADGPFEVTFLGETYQIPEGESVLDVFEDEDVPIMSRCQDGTCGTCVVKVIEGVPDHRDSFFTEEQHENGAFTTCVSRSLSPSLTLERWKNL
ncbi:PDR/VanB family oxidoreductase [Corynebacterium glaucum]|uniref:PDR/VanB family oxidoreductase n=1 Tax=Corynebacterium glaucum TaxID=187491 RepID=UPI0025B5AEBD|nr:PDR/VanB family oxidoreductase [Corynebacterium glaucum]